MLTRVPDDGGGDDDHDHDDHAESATPPVHVVARDHRPHSDGTTATVAMERKRSGRRYYNKRQKSWTQQCKDYLRQFIAFLFSNIGIICLVVGYTIAGAFMFIVIEGPAGNAKATIDRVTANRTGTVARLWDLTCCNAYCEDEWRNEVQVHLRSFQSHIIEAVRNSSYEGPNKENNRWSFSGSFLYSLSVITTIGE